MKKLFKVSCSGKFDTFYDIYVIADTYEDAGNKALQKMKDLRYDKVSDYVSTIELLADEKETTKKLLIL